MPRVLLIFVDGVGIGRDDPSINPFSRIDNRIFSSFLDEPARDIYRSGHVRETDASLGVPGLPQSATGQSAILSGINAAAYLGGHLSGLPNRALKELLSRESIFAKLNRLGRRSTFANAYQPSFFNGTPRWISVTTAACTSAGIRLRTLEDLASGDAVYQDFTHRYLREKGYAVPERSPEEAGRNLARIASDHDFTLYEYFLTDRMGHSQDMSGSIEVLEMLQHFVVSVLDHADLDDQMVLISSDHGNIEDLSRKSHTLNPVPTIGWGRFSEETVERISSLEDVTPAILEALE